MPFGTHTECMHGRTNLVHADCALLRFARTIHSLGTYGVSGLTQASSHQLLTLSASCCCSFGQELVQTLLHTAGCSRWLLLLLWLLQLLLLLHRCASSSRRCSADHRRSLRGLQQGSQEWWLLLLLQRRWRWRMECWRFELWLLCRGKQHLQAC